MSGTVYSRKALSTKRCIETYNPFQTAKFSSRKALSTKRCIETNIINSVQMDFESESTEHQKVH